MSYQMEDLTHDDIRRASDNSLRAWLKEDIDPNLDDMINYELYIREHSQTNLKGVHYTPERGYFFDNIEEQ